MFATPTRTALAIAAISAATVLFAAGCSDDSDSDAGMPGMSGMPGMTRNSAAPTADHNDADVAFLESMYPHHAEAVEMAELVPARSQDPAVVALAASIEKAQTPEMVQIGSLLQSFGRPAPQPDRGGMHNMPGMMPDGQIESLKVLSGKDFDRQWLTLMIDHHSSAIAMANAELAGGANSVAKGLAGSIATAQQAEIDQMRGMLGPN